MEEVWKEITGYNGYSASNLGNIKSHLTDKEGKILSKRHDKDGYEVVWTKYKPSTRVHQLVLLAFRPEEYREGLIVNHIDGVKNNNILSNLEWTTISKNTKHAYDNNLAVSASSEPVGVFYNKEMISLFNSKSKLAKYCGVSRATIEILSKENGIIFDELVIKELPPKDYSLDLLYEKPFINIPLSRYQLKPCKIGSIYYESIKQASEITGLSRKKISLAINKNKYINGDIVKSVTRFEYVSQ